MKPILKSFLVNRENKTEFVKDAFHEAIVDNKNYNKLRAKQTGYKMFTGCIFMKIKAQAI